MVRGGGLSACHLQQKPKVQGDTVDLYKESYDCTGHIQVSVEGVQETPDHLQRKHIQMGGDVMLLYKVLSSILTVFVKVLSSWPSCLCLLVPYFLGSFCFFFDQHFETLL